MRSLYSYKHDKTGEVWKEMTAMSSWYFQNTKTCSRLMKWNESGFRPPLCTDRLNWARRTSWGWWDDWDDTVLQTQDSKFTSDEDRLGYSEISVQGPWFASYNRCELFNGFDCAAHLNSHARISLQAEFYKINTHCKEKTRRLNM